MMVKEIFDDEFTRSRRGLLIIFSIGFIHQLLEIKFIDAKISIPGLPEIIASHPERIVYAYILLVFYATYRYVLNSKMEFSEICRMAFSWGIETTLGRFFSSNYITSDMYRVSNDSNYIKNNVVVLNAYEEDSVSYIIGFNLDSCFFKECWVELPPSISNPMLLNSPTKEQWGFYNTTHELDPEEQRLGITSYEAYRIKSKTIKGYLYAILLFSIIICLIKNPKAFDYWTPVVLNIILMIWMMNSSGVLSSILK
ncbi:hypothetical protein ACW5WK_07500 [Aeromonas enteropelogenes]|uniref:hypothetical protein n=2 Tax=Aeromonas enteropelogenes TaxID=29489 RepID=UPI000AE9C23A|nr:hypothetical protein [Aeromonas enteropelogenes]UBH55271.1 hypothetical protein LA341_15400 [Aeromonas enteropelogenes]